MKIEGARGTALSIQSLKQNRMHSRILRAEAAAKFMQIAI